MVSSNTVAIVCHFAGCVKDYDAQFEALVVAWRPERCPHCGGESTCIFWGTYARWVYTITDRLQVRIQRVRCIACHVTDALLPSFLHLFRRYALTLIQHAVTLALDAGLWGDALADVVGPYGQPALATLREWLWSFAHGAELLSASLQHTLTTLDPLADLDPGRPPDHLRAIRYLPRRTAFTHAWQFLRLGDVLYAASRARQPGLAFQADAVLAFLAAALLAAGRPPRLLWRHAPARAPT
jgi:hypothetical protein